MIVEKASIPWHFKIEAESPSEEVPIESLYAYGVQWDKTATSPDCTRIGNMDLHATLPIQSQMKGCLLNDHGDVVKYLPDSGWTEETLDGSLGQVMVELPEFWWKFSESGNTQSVMLSQVPLDGYKHVKKTYVSAYEATIDRGTDATGGTSHSTEWKLASVKNTTTRYRGGNNTASNDSAYNSQLGLPVTHMGMDSGRKAARLRKPSTYEWNIYTYQQMAEGYARYINKHFPKNPSVVIGHDNRINSDLFSLVCANVLTTFGIKVYLFKNNHLTPTPIISFAIRFLNASGGIIVTASHNPKEYNGFKAYNPDGGQVLPDVAAEIEKYMPKNDSLVHNIYIGSAKLLREIDEKLIDNKLLLFLLSYNSFLYNPSLFLILLL